MRPINLKQWLPRGRHFVISAPYLWLLVFFFLPFVFVAKISVAEAELAIPPYTPMFDWLEGVLNIRISLSNFAWLLDDPIYLLAYTNSIKVAFWSTVFCLLLGYPMAYAIAKLDVFFNSCLCLDGLAKEHWAN
jgi:putrescine transport system permease protein